MVEVDRNMQQKNVLALLRNKGFQFTDTFFPYTSGEIGPYYVQSAAMMANGRDYADACQNMATMIRRTVGDNFQGVVSGGESRDWCFSGPVAQILGCSHTMIYKKDDSGQCKTIGADLKWKQVIHVADLNNEGSSPRDMWVPTVRLNNGKIENIFFYVDRMEKGVDEVKKLGLQSQAVVPLDKDAWEILQLFQGVSKEVYQSLCKRSENRQAWAESMLRSPEGNETLANLLRDPVSRKKGQKILNVGYPHMKEELVHKMKVKHNYSDVNNWLECH